MKDNIVRELDKFRVIYGLKQVYRFNSVGKRKESTAEHISSTLLLADFLMEQFDFKVDKMHVFELILYHDVVELYSGDMPLHPSIKIVGQKEKEAKDSVRLSKVLPKVVSTKYLELFREFEARKTREAKLAKAIEQLDAEIHELDYKKDWKGWTEKFLREKKEKYLADFPQLKDLFERHIKYCRENGYFDQ